MKYTVEIILTLHDKMTPDQVKELLMEQWEQTPAFENGDRIHVNLVEELWA